jgi:ribosome-interacting GTPase 1
MRYWYLGVQDVIERIWKELRLMRLYTKRYDTSTIFSFIEVSDQYRIYRKGEDPKFDEALIVRKDSTIALISVPSRCVQ